MITYHGQTDVGKRRTLNEDTIFTDDGLFVVCDGMGGHKAGQGASKIDVAESPHFVQRSRADVDFEVASQELTDRDIVLLCSAGLSNMLTDRRIHEIVSAHGTDLQRGCDALVTAANAEGGRDNISAILARYTA